MRQWQFHHFLSCQQLRLSLSGAVLQLLPSNQAADKPFCFATSSLGERLLPTLGGSCISCMRSSNSCRRRRTSSPHLSAKGLCPARLSSITRLTHRAEKPKTCAHNEGKGAQHLGIVYPVTAVRTLRIYQQAALFVKPGRHSILCHYVRPPIFSMWRYWSDSTICTLLSIFVCISSPTFIRIDTLRINSVVNSRVKRDDIKFSEFSLNALQ